MYLQGNYLLILIHTVAHKCVEPAGFKKVFILCNNVFFLFSSLVFQPGDIGITLSVCCICMNKDGFTELNLSEN